MLLWLRVWVGVVAVMALGSAVQCFLNEQYPQQRIYTLRPSEGDHLYILRIYCDKILK